MIDSLPELEDSAAALHVKERVEELHAQAATLRSRLSALETPPGPASCCGAPGRTPWPGGLLGCKALWMPCRRSSCDL